MSDLIVINLGLPKSGTTTLARGLREAGLTVADYRIRRPQTNDPYLQGRFIGQELYHGYFTSGDPLQNLSDFNGFTEISLMRRARTLWPQTDWGIINAIRKHHKGVKFLASTRDPQEQALSMLRWSDMGLTRLPRASVPGLPRGYGQTNLERARWISAHHSFLRQVFENDDCFLEYSIEDTHAAEKISHHIGRDLPWWGHLNTNMDSPAKHPKRTPA